MSPSPSRVLAAAALVYPVLAVYIAVWTPLSFGDAVFLPALLVLLPAVGVAQVPLAAVESLPPKLGVYAASAGTTLLLGVLAVAVGARHDGLGAVGLRGMAVRPLLGWTAALAAAGILVIVLSRLLAGRLGIRESELLRHLLPEGVRERGAFTLLSASAGFGEEAAFRGYAIPVLAQASGSIWAGVVISSLAFGIVHAYQGVAGVMRSGVLAVLLALPVVLMGNVWPAILAHTVIDVIAGAVLGRWLAGLGEGE